MQSKTPNPSKPPESVAHQRAMHALACANKIEVPYGFSEINGITSTTEVLFIYKQYVELTIMNYNGAEGLEFGGGNTKVDPIVAASMSMTLAKSTVLLLRNVQIYPKTVK